MRYGWGKLSPHEQPNSRRRAQRSRRRSWVDTAVRPDYKPALPGHGLSGNAQVAQLVEHATENRSVGGSIPPLGTIGLPHCCSWRFILRPDQLVAFTTTT